MHLPVDIDWPADKDLYTSREIWNIVQPGVLNPTRKDLIWLWKTLVSYYGAKSVLGGAPIWVNGGSHRVLSVRNHELYNSIKNIRLHLTTGERPAEPTPSPLDIDRWKDHDL